MIKTVRATIKRSICASALIAIAFSALLYLLISDISRSERTAGAGASMQVHSASPVRTDQYSWGLEKIDAPDAWQTTQGNNQIIVALLDSGVDHSHKDLANNIWQNPNEIAGNGVDDDLNGYVDDIRGWDFQDYDNDSLSGSSIFYHGTFAAGLIAASLTEGRIAGVAPNVRIMDLRILDSRNRFKYREWPLLVEAVHYAIDNGARVINLSIFSNEEPPVEFHNALKRAYQQNIVVVGATGNSAPEVLFPGRYEEVIAISAINNDDSISSFSVSGTEVEYAAPGNEVESLMPDDKYGTSSGTSWAAAHVSGAVALRLSLEPNSTVSEIKGFLSASVTDLGVQGRDEIFGHGLINAGRLVRSN